MWICISDMSVLATKAAKSQRHDLLLAERKEFERQRTKLLRRYPGHYVAFYRGQLVGHNKDQSLLAEDMFSRLGDVPFYIARVEKRPTVYDLPGPEVEG